MGLFPCFIFFYPCDLVIVEADVNTMLGQFGLVGFIIEMGHIGLFVASSFFFLDLLHLG